MKTHGYVVQADLLADIGVSLSWPQSTCVYEFQPIKNFQ